MKNWKIMTFIRLKTFLTSLLIFVSIPSIAASCLDFFPSVLSSSSNSGKALLKGEVVLTGTDGTIDIAVTEDYHSVPSCVSQTCVDSTDRANSIVLPTFQESNSNQNYSIGNNNTLSLAQGSYRRINLNYRSTVRFTQNDEITYIRSLNSSSSETTFIFEEGTYWIENFTAAYRSNIIINGNDKVTLIINNSDFNQSQIAFNESGSPEQLSLITYNDVSFGFQNIFNGFIYANSKVFIDDQSVFNGAINGDDITLDYKATINYAENSIESASFDGLCSSTSSPIAEYRFDETQYNDVANEVIESIGGLHGQAKSAQPVKGQVCNAVDLSATGTADYVILDEAILDGKTDFTISLWSKSAKTSNQSFISGATSSSRSYNELIMWFINHRNFQPHLQNTNNGNLAITSIAGDTWRHLVWTRSGTQSCLYIDSVLQGCITQSDETLEIDSLILGQEQDSVGGSFVSSQAFDGLIDELLIFDNAISTDEVSEIYKNQSNGLGYDGSVRTCPTPEAISPLAEYRFEEDTWNGNAGEILNSSSSGDDYNGQVIRGSTLVNPGINPALTGNPGTCGYASQNNGSIQVTGLPLDTSVGKKTTITFWMNWDGTENVMPIGWNNHDIWIVSGSLGFNTWNNDVYGISSSGLANSWHHIAVEFTNGNVTSNRIYIDGIEQTLTQQYGNINNSNAYVNSEIRIGGVSNTSLYDFHGYLDEVRIYESALTPTQINTIMNERHACDDLTPEIDHYEIVHDGSGLTCNAESVTIKACTDSTCSSLSTESITLDLQATSALSGLETKSAVAFDNGSATVSFNHFTAETITLSIANENIGASNATTCSLSTGSSCDINFADSGFIFDVPTQTACAVSNEITMSAVRKDNTTQQCVPSFESVNKTLKFWTRFDNPSSASKSITLTHNSNDYSLPTSEGISVPVSFDENGQTTFQVTYPDAGQLTLNASYDGTSSSNDLGLRMIGNDQFVSVPAKLVVDTPDSNADCATNNANCSAFKAAGENFNFTVSATCSDGTVTPNFQMDNIALTVNDIAPNIGNPVSLSITNIDISDTDNGAHTETTQTISEVGVFSITATPNNLYFTETIAPVTSSSIGRFTPSYYQLDGIDNGVLNGGNPFVYTGQMQTSTSLIGQISYLTQPEFTITAKSVNDSTTLNYSGDFIKLSETAISRETPTQDAIQKGKDATNEVDLSATLSSPLFAEYTPGVLKYQFNSSDNYVYTRNANSLIAPFTNAIDLQINSVIDSDGIQATDLDSDSTNGVLTLQPQGLEIRFGRWIMENSYGPETADIRLPMFTQYWNGNYFVNNDADSFSSFNAMNASIVDNQLSPAGIPTIVGSGLFSDGESNELIVESPGGASRGSVTVTHIVPPWLKYDWSVIDESYDENPSAIATFGLYRGNDRIIYRQEVFD